MTVRIHPAIGEAMTRLKAADVAGATTALQRALADRPARDQPQPGSSDADNGKANARMPRRLGEILQTLRARRAQFAERAGAPHPAADAGDDDGRFRPRNFRSATGSLDYKLYVPADHAARPSALIMMLHGCTQNPDDFARGTRMNALADEFGLVVAYPHQPRAANAQGCWNWFDARHQRRGAGEPEILAGLAHELALDFGIDRRRVFVAGLSAGGAMADVLSSTYPDIFSAAGIHSGVPHGAASDAMSAFAAMKGNTQAASRTTGKTARQIIFHGTADATVHPSNGERLFERARGAEGRQPELTTGILVNGRHVTRTIAGAADGPAAAEYWLVQDGGHAWSGGDDRGSFADASGPDASREMIRFFLES